MNRAAPLVALAVSLALAGCGEKKAEVVPGTERPAGAPKAADVPKAAPAAAPAAKWSSVDAKGFDWAAQMGSIRFDTDWQAAMARAKSSDKPLLLLFTEKTSADAAKLAATFKDPRVVAAAEAFVVALVDNDENGPLADRFGVKGVPMLVYASPSGEALGATIGVNADEVLGDIKSALATMKEDADEAK